MKSTVVISSNPHESWSEFIGAVGAYTEGICDFIFLKSAPHSQELQACLNTLNKQNQCLYTLDERGLVRYIPDITFHRVSHGQPQIVNELREFINTYKHYPLETLLTKQTMCDPPTVLTRRASRLIAVMAPRMTYKQALDALVNATKTLAISYMSVDTALYIFFCYTEAETEIFN